MNTFKYANQEVKFMCKIGAQTLNALKNNLPFGKLNISTLITANWLMAFCCVAKFNQYTYVSMNNPLRQDVAIIFNADAGSF